MLRVARFSFANTHTRVAHTKSTRYSTDHSHARSHISHSCSLHPRGGVAGGDAPLARGPRSAIRFDFGGDPRFVFGLSSMPLGLLATTNSPYVYTLLGALGEPCRSEPSAIIAVVCDEHSSTNPLLPQMGGRPCECCGRTRRRHERRRHERRRRQRRRRQRCGRCRVERGRWRNRRGVQRWGELRAESELDRDEIENTVPALSLPNMSADAETSGQTYLGVSKPVSGVTMPNGIGAL